MMEHFYFKKVFIGLVFGYPEEEYFLSNMLTWVGLSETDFPNTVVEKNCGLEWTLLNLRGS